MRHRDHRHPLLLAFCLLVGCRTEATQIERGWSAYKGGDCQRAAKLFRAVLANHARSGEALYGLGLASVACGDPVSGEHWLGRSIETLSSNKQRDDASVRLSDLYLARHAGEDAYMVAVGAMSDQILAHDPANADGHRLWARRSLIKASNLRAKGFLTEAQDWYRKSIDEFQNARRPGSNRPDVSEGLALALEESGDLFNSEAAWRQVLAAHSGSRKPYFHLLSIQTALSDPQAVSATVSNALERYPLDYGFLHEVMRKLRTLNNREMLLRVTSWLEDAAKQNPRESFELAKLFESMGDKDRALGQYGRCQAVPEIGQRCSENRIRLLIGLHRAQETASAIEALKTAYPNSSQTKQLQAQFLVEAQRANEAIPLLVALKSNDPSNIVVMLTLARAWACPLT